MSEDDGEDRIFSKLELTGNTIFFFFFIIMLNFYVGFAIFSFPDYVEQ